MKNCIETCRTNTYILFTLTLTEKIVNYLLFLTDIIHILHQANLKWCKTFSGNLLKLLTLFYANLCRRVIPGELWVFTFWKGRIISKSCFKLNTFIKIDVIFH